MLSFDELQAVVAAVESGVTSGADTLLATDDAAQRAQARPGSLVQAVAVHAGEPSIDQFTWGFPIQGGKKLVFNTRLESALAGSGMWATAIRNGRCLFPVASFFEPHLTEVDTSPRTGRPIKRQYEFAGADGAPLLLAAVANNGRLSVVTTEPNAAVAPIHPRMPLVLRFEEVPVWLEGDYASLADRSGLTFEIAPETITGPRHKNAEPHEAARRVADDAQLSLF